MKYTQTNKVLNLINLGKQSFRNGNYDAAVAWLSFAIGEIENYKKLMARYHSNARARDLVAEIEKSLPDYIEVGGLKWALTNAGTDAENPNGRHYTYEEALKLENNEWRLPTYEDLNAFIECCNYSFDEVCGVGIFIDKKTGAKLEFPAVCTRGSNGTMYAAGMHGRYWSFAQLDFNYAYYLAFGSGSVSVSSYYNKTSVFSVRLVRR